MQFETILISVLGIAFAVSVIYGVKTEKDLIRVTAEKEALRISYEAERQTWKDAIQLQNSKLEQYMTDTKTYIETVTIKQETLAKSTQQKQDTIAKSLAKDSSDKNIIYETNKLLHDFSNGR